ncbi:MAG: histidine kinase [Clostridia bacterium]|nr:histidine kinase [Clostridia bacterium]
MLHLKKSLSYIRTYKFSSLFVRNTIITFCAIIVPVFLLYSVTYTLSRNNTTEYISSINQELCNTIKNITDTSVDEMTKLAATTSFTEDVTSLMLFPSSDSERDNRLRNYLKNFLFVYDYLDSAYIFCEDSEKIICSDLRVTNLSKLEDLEWYETYENITSTKSSVKFRKYKNHYPYLLTIVQPIYTTPSRRAGAIVFNIDVKKLFHSFKTKEFSHIKHLMIINSDGQIIYSNDNNKISTFAQEDESLQEIASIENRSTVTIESNGENLVATHLSSRTYDWGYYCSIPASHYESQLLELFRTIFTMLFLSLILSMIISIYISKKVFQPIENIMDTLDSPAPWQLSENNKKKPTEADYILQKIFNAKQANQLLLEEQEKRVEMLKHAQTLMLQLQINPHFLGNTLNAINWMAVELTMSSNDVSKAISMLSNMHKSISDTTNYMTTLESEIEYTQQYIELMKLRYPNAFEVVWDFDDSLKNAKLPRVLLQPLVENAIYYGIVPSQKRGTITVKISSEKGVISVVILDNGVGMNEEKMNQMNKEFLDEYVCFNGSIGLKNVNQRLRLIYGETYGVELKQSESGGVEVHLHFPYIT